MKLNILKIFFVLSIIWYLFFSLNAAFSQAPKYDDVWHYQMVETIDTYGRPLLYFGEDSAYRYNSSEINGTISGLVHPVLGPYSLYLFYILLGKSQISLRILGILVTFLTVYLIFQICFLIYSDKKKSKQVAYFASVLYLMSPLIIQMSLLQTMDTLFYPLLLNLLIYCFFKYKYSNYNFILFGFLFGLILLFKYTTVCFIILSIFLYYLFNKEYKLAFIVSLLTSLIGITLFVFIQGLYSVLVRESFWFVIKFTLISRVVSSGFSLIVVAKHFLSALSYDMFWISPAIVLFFIFSIENFVSCPRIKKNEGIHFLIVFILITWLAYSLKAPNINYKFPLFSLLTIIISNYLYDSGVLNWKFITIGSFVWGYILFLFKDPLLILPKLLPYNQETIFNLWILGVYFLPLLLLLFFNKKENLLLILIFSFFIAMNLHQAVGDYSTISIYGERGYEETINYLKNTLSSNKLYIARWDVGYNIGGKFYSDDDFTLKNLCGIDNTKIYRNPSTCGQITGPYKTNMTYILDEKNIIYIAHSSFFEELDGGFNKKFKERLKTDYTLEKEFGDFKVYRKKSQY